MSEPLDIGARAAGRLKDQKSDLSRFEKTYAKPVKLFIEHLEEYGGIIDTDIQPNGTSDNWNQKSVVLTIPVDVSEGQDEFYQSHLQNIHIGAIIYYKESAELNENHEEKNTNLTAEYRKLSDGVDIFYDDGEERQEQIQGSAKIYNHDLGQPYIFFDHSEEEFPLRPSKYAEITEHIVEIAVERGKVVIDFLQYMQYLAEDEPPTSSYPGTEYQPY